MKKCVHCGEMIDDKDTYCLYCGKQQPSSNANAPKATKKRRAVKKPAQLPVQPSGGGRHRRPPISVADEPEIERAQVQKAREEKAQKEEEKRVRQKEETQSKKQQSVEKIPGNPLPTPQEMKRVEGGRYNDNYDGYYDDVPAKDEDIKQGISKENILRAAKIIAIGILAIVVIEVLVAFL